MRIQNVHCPNCGSKKIVTDEIGRVLTGGAYKCNKCGDVFQIRLLKAGGTWLS